VISAVAKCFYETEIVCCIKVTFWPSFVYYCRGLMTEYFLRSSRKIQTRCRLCTICCCYFSYYTYH